MREILFRAWDGRKMRTKDLVVYEGDLYMGWRNFEDGITSDDPLMQYTGLTDKNGVKIFDGDIVSAWSQGWNATGEVKHRIDGLWFMYPAYQHKIMWGLCPNPEGKTSVEVIGNIYENPELLNG